MSAESISVVIPVFNCERYLGEAIQSVLCQGHRHVEIIVVDDGSTDASQAVANSFAGVRCVPQENRGIAAARNAGVAQAQGDLLAFLDADDLWTEDKLSAQLEVMRAHPEAHIVAGAVEQFSVNELPRQPASVSPGGEAYTAGAMLIRREDFLRVGTFDERLRVGEFIDWHSRAKSLGLRETCLDRVVLRRRIHDANTTLKQQDSRGDYLLAIRAHLHRQRRVAC